MRFVEAARPYIGDIDFAVSRYHLATLLVEELGNNHLSIPEDDPDLCPLLETGMRRPHKLSFDLLQELLVIF